MWLIVSSQSCCLHLLFCCVLSILALIRLVLMALFCAAIRRDSVSLLKFAFLCQVQVIIIIISKSSSRYTTALVNVPRVTITIVIIVTFMFQSVFSSLARFWYISIFSLFLVWTTKANFRQMLFSFSSFLGTFTKSGGLDDIKWSVCLSKS